MGHNKKGFTLIELIISITVLIIGISAIFTLTMFSIQLNKENMVKIQALELAREGMEAMRNIRDSNWINNYPYNGGDPLWGESFSEQKEIIVSPIFDETVSSAPWKITTIVKDDIQQSRLYENTLGAVKVYSHDFISQEQSKASPFYRYISIIPEDEDHNITRIVCTVFWYENSKEKQVSLHEILTNWKKL